MRRNRFERPQRTDFLRFRLVQNKMGDDYRDEFEQVAVPHMAALYNNALHLTMNSDDAEDLLQETYFKAYRFWNQFEPGTNIKAWLFQIMKNAYINRYRKKAKEPKSVEFDESMPHHHPARHAQAEHHHVVGKTPHDIFEDEIAHSLESLPSDYRTVVMLSDVEDFTYEEIANVIAVPLGTVRSRLHRGRRLLREKLRNYARTNGYLL